MHPGNRKQVHKTTPLPPQQPQTTTNPLTQATTRADCEKHPKKRLKRSCFMLVVGQPVHSSNNRQTHVEKGQKKTIAEGTLPKTIVERGFLHPWSQCGPASPCSSASLSHKKARVWTCECRNEINPKGPLHICIYIYYTCKYVYIYICVSIYTWVQWYILHWSIIEHNSIKWQIYAKNFLRRLWVFIII